MTPKQKKIAAYTAGALVVGVVSYLVFFNNTEGGDGVDPTGNGNVTPNDLGSAFNAHKIATELYEVMAPAGYANVILNPDEADTIMSILAPVTPAQFDQVVNAFGQLKYNKTLGSQVALPFQTLSRYGLAVWLKTELGTGSDVYKTLKLKYPKHL